MSDSSFAVTRSSRPSPSRSTAAAARGTSNGRTTKGTKPRRPCRQALGTNAQLWKIVEVAEDETSRADAPTAIPNSIVNQILAAKNRNRSRAVARVV